MEIDESIARLGAKLDAWFENNSEIFASTDRSAQGKALLHGYAIAKELTKLKAQGLKLLAAQLDRYNSSAVQEHVESLVRSFELGAKLAHSLHDELLDTEGEAEVVHLLDAIVKRLDETQPGRAVLSVLLDHRDAGVRASAAAYLLKVMPERVLPVLDEIESSEDGNSAHFTAYFAKLIWERGRNKTSINSG